jgi:hypothetical protein
VEAHRVVRRRGFHIFKTIGSQMVVRLSALRTGRPLPRRKIPGTHFCQWLSRPQDHSAAGKIRTLLPNWSHPTPSRISLWVRYPQCMTYIIASSSETYYIMFPTCRENQNRRAVWVLVQRTDSSLRLPTSGTT